MNPFEMVVAIIFLVTVGKVLQARFRSQEKGAGRASGADAAEAARLRDEVRGLKERVQVLERVVTDNEGGLRLDREIDRLRDRDHA